MAKVLIPTVSKMTKTGRKNGNPSTKIPSRIGNNATDAAAKGTVGTSNILADGNRNGNVLVMDVTAEDVAPETESMVENHACARVRMALNSVLYGPVRHNLRRSVG